MLNDFVERSHELHQVVTGHGRRDCEDAEHGTAPHVFLQRGHLAGKRMGTRPHVVSEDNGRAGYITLPTAAVTAVTFLSTLISFCTFVDIKEKPGTVVSIGTISL